MKKKLLFDPPGIGRRKILMVMKWLFIFNVCCLLSISATTLSQKQKFSFSLKNAQLTDVFKAIEEQSGLSFIYQEDRTRLDEAKNVDYKNATVDEILDQLLNDTGFSYKVMGNYIAIIKKESTERDVSQQEQRVTGKVVDTSGEALPGVNVYEKSQPQNGVITGIDGTYQLNVSKEDATIIFSYIGFEMQEIQVGGQTSINITLVEEMTGLDEVVVVGYGTQKKVNLTGSVQAINSESLEKRPVGNVTQMLQGQIAGASFSVGNSGMEPGAEMNIDIRGVGSLSGGSPYILIDGVPGNLSDLNPNDIESMSVLKDAASAAIYGAQAAYGVVLVTTKSGSRNEKISVSASFSHAVTAPTALPEMPDSYSFARAMNEAGSNHGGLMFKNDNIDRIIAYQNGELTDGTIPDPKTPSKWAYYNGAHANNDWFDIWYGNGSMQQGNVSVRGGSKKSSYYISTGYVKEEGLLNFVTDRYRRNNITVNFTTDLTDWWSFKYQNRFSKSTRKRTNMWIGYNYNVLFHQIARIWPNFPVRTPNGAYSYRSQIGFADSGYDTDEYAKMYNTFSTKITPLKGWSVNASYTYMNRDRIKNEEQVTTYQDQVDGTPYKTPSTYPNQLRTTQESDRYSNAEVYSTYETSLNNVHSFSLTAGMQYQKNLDRALVGYQKEMVTQEVMSLSTATGDFGVTDALSHGSTLGYFGRFMYNFKEKYLFEFNARRDGTSKFAEGNRWGFFPSFSGGWNMSKENFWSPLSNVVNTFKLRGSWGQLGNQNVSAYQDLPLLAIKKNLGWMMNGARPVYVGAPKLTSANVTWETAETIDVGFDFGALRNRLTGSFDWFQRTTYDMLGPAEALPAVIGASVPKENNATLRTRGFDLTVGWKDKIGSNFSYRANFMLSDYVQEVTKYRNPTGLLSTWYKGRKVGEIWGYEAVGLIQDDMYDEKGYVLDGKKIDQSFIYGQWQTGDVAYKDLDGDGKVGYNDFTLDNHGDIKVIGNSQPRYQWGLNLGATFKNLDLSMLWQGVAEKDHWFSYTQNFFWGFRSMPQTTLFKEHLDYYRDTEATKYSGLGVNKDAYFPRAYLSHGNPNLKNRRTSDRYLQDASYVRLKNITLTYTVPKLLTGKVGLSDVKVYFSGENLLTFTDLPDAFDPETLSTGSYGNGKSHMPQKFYSFGVEVKF